VDGSALMSSAVVPPTCQQDANMRHINAKPTAVFVKQPNFAANLCYGTNRPPLHTPESPPECTECRGRCQLLSVHPHWTNAHTCATINDHSHLTTTILGTRLHDGIESSPKGDSLVRFDVPRLMKVCEDRLCLHIGSFFGGMHICASVCVCFMDEIAQNLFPHCTQLLHGTPPNSNDIGLRRRVRLRQCMNPSFVRMSQ